MASPSTPRDEQVASSNEEMTGLLTAAGNEGATFSLLNYPCVRMVTTAGKACVVPITPAPEEHGEKLFFKVSLTESWLHCLVGDGQKTRDVSAGSAILKRLSESIEAATKQAMKGNEDGALRHRKVSKNAERLKHKVANRPSMVDVKMPLSCGFPDGPTYTLTALTHRVPIRIELTEPNLGWLNKYLSDEREQERQVRPKEKSEETIGTDAASQLPAVFFSSSESMWYVRGKIKTRKIRVPRCKPGTDEPLSGETYKANIRAMREEAEHEFRKQEGDAEACTLGATSTAVDCDVTANDPLCQFLAGPTVAPLTVHDSPQKDKAVSISSLAPLTTPNKRAPLENSTPNYKKVRITGSKTQLATRASSTLEGGDNGTLNGEDEHVGSVCEGTGFV